MDAKSSLPTLPCVWLTLACIFPVSATAFYRAQSCVNFLCEVIGLQGNELSAMHGLTDSQRVKFTKEIKGLKVRYLIEVGLFYSHTDDICAASLPLFRHWQIEITHCGVMRRKYRVCNVTRRSAATQNFPLELESGQTVECTVAEYFQKKHNKKLE